MTEMNPALLGDLPSDVQALLARPPVEDTMLLELAARWERLPSALAGMAEALRVFVVTWDPLEWVRSPISSRRRSAPSTWTGRWSSST